MIAPTIDRMCDHRERHIVYFPAINSVDVGQRNAVHDPFCEVKVILLAHYLFQARAHIVYPLPGCTNSKLARKSPPEALLACCSWSAYWDGQCHNLKDHRSLPPPLLNVCIEHRDRGRAYMSAYAQAPQKLTRRRTVNNSKQSCRKATMFPE